MGKLLATIGFGLIFASTAAAAAPAAKASKPVERQYCFKFEDTGSHLARTECRTKSEWKQLGVDVDEVIQN
jgi:hypothetical protein